MFRSVLRPSSGMQIQSFILSFNAFACILHVLVYAKTIFRYANTNFLSCVSLNIQTLTLHERELRGSSLHRREFFQLEEMNFRMYLKFLLKMGRIRRPECVVHNFIQMSQTGSLKCMQENSEFHFQNCVIVCHERRCQPICALKFSGLQCRTQTVACHS